MGDELNLEEENSYLPLRGMSEASGSSDNTEISERQRFQEMRSSLKDYNQLSGRYDNLVDSNPESAEAYNNRGIFKARTGQYEEAIKDFSTALSFKEDFPRVYNNRGVSYERYGQVEAAIEDYDRAIQLQANFPEAYNNRGNLKMKLRDVEAAEKDYDMAIQYNPDYPEAFFNRGLLKKELKNDSEGAVEDYSKAIDLNPNYAAAINNRANIKLSLGEVSAAIEDYEAAFMIKPQSKAIKANLEKAKAERQAVCQ